ncbi:MAG: hypothetical protein IK066_11560 [Kiritimatiellae bacterium]|nr:hypothetical protein [Kiritimatiellia bacterium]
MLSFTIMLFVFMLWRTQIYDFRTGWIRQEDLEKAEDLEKTEDKEKAEDKKKKKEAFGEFIVNFYQRVLGGIALPIP